MANNDDNKSHGGGGGNGGHGGGPGPSPKTYTIYVNGRAKTVDNDEQTYESIVKLAYGQVDTNAKYTVTFERDDHAAPQELVPGGKPVKIKDGKSRFTVEETGQS